MNFRIAFHIFRKELVETLRDKRTLFALFLLPVILNPLLVLVTSQLGVEEMKQRDAIKPQLAIWGPVSEELVSALEHDGAKVIERRDAPPPLMERDVEAEKLFAEEHVHVVVVADRARDAVGTLSLELLYDTAKDRSEAAHERVKKSLNQIGSDRLTALLKEHGLPPEMREPIHVTHHSIGGKQRDLVDVMARTIPPIMLFIIVMAGILPAIDLTAGEKERGTLQTLLCAPVRPLEIVAGKYMAVVAVSTAGTIANFIAMSLALARGVSTLDHADLAIGVRSLFAVFGTLLPAVLLSSALLLSFAVFARSFREANALLTPIMLVILVVPTIGSSIPGVHLSKVTAFIPFLNLMLLAKELLRGQVAAELYLAVMVSSLAFTCVALTFAARVFETEQVLLGGERPWRDVFGRSIRDRATPSPRNAVLFVAVLLVVTYYGTLLLQNRSLRVSMVAQQVGLFLLPALIWTQLFRFNFRATFSLRLPSARGLLGGVLLALGSWAVGSVVFLLLTRFFPGAQIYNDDFAKLLGEIDLPLGLAISILPAICEEACFRGVVLSGIGNTGSRTTAIVGSALLFGLFHINPYHVATATAVGLVLSAAALETGSIYVAILIHFANNGLRVLSTRVPALETLTNNKIAIVFGCVLTACGLFVVRGSRRSQAI